MDCVNLTEVSQNVSVHTFCASIWEKVCSRVSHSRHDCRQIHHFRQRRGVVSLTGQIYPDDTVGYFRIASATGRQPIEPIALGKFLIGSASQCHLRFGNSEIPEVHTVLNVERDAVLLQSSVTDPPILVNGLAETECRLSDGDMLELGDHRMLFRFAASEQRITLDEEQFDQRLSSGEVRVDNVVSAEQLVDRLEEQINLVEELTHSPNDAMMDLLRAVTEANATDTTDERAVAVPMPTELQQVTSLLQKHHEASRIRLESLTEVLDNVVRQQKLIADTLEVLSERVQALDTGTGFQQRRASA